MIKKKKSQTKKLSHFDKVGIYSSGVKMILKVWFTPMETTTWIADRHSNGGLMFAIHILTVHWNTIFVCHVSGNCCNYRVACSTLRTLTSESSLVESSLAAMVWMCLELNLSNDNSTSSRSAPFTSFTRMLLFWKLKVQFESSWKRMAKN